MSVIGTAFTLQDLARRLDPKGKVDKIVELLKQTAAEYRQSEGCKRLPDNAVGQIERCTRRGGCALGFMFDFKNVFALG